MELNHEQLEFLEKLKIKSEEKMRMHQRPHAKNIFYARRHQKDVEMIESILNTVKNAAS